MRLYERIVSLHPAVVTLAFFALFGVSALALSIEPFGTLASMTLFSVVMVLFLAPVMLWHYSLYRVASDRGKGFVGHGGRRAFLFVLASGAISVYLVFFPFWFPMGVDSPAYRALGVAIPITMAIGNLSYFVAIWASANALVRFEERAKSAEFHKTLGTFILEAYLPIGIWVIYPRIRRLLEASSPVA